MVSLCPFVEYLYLLMQQFSRTFVLPALTPHERICRYDLSLLAMEIPSVPTLLYGVQCSLRHLLWPWTRISFRTVDVNLGSPPLPTSFSPPMIVSHLQLLVSVTVKHSSSHFPCIHSIHLYVMKLVHVNYVWPYGFNKSASMGASCILFVPHSDSSRIRGPSMFWSIGNNDWISSSTSAFVFFVCSSSKAWFVLVRCLQPKPPSARSQRLNQESFQLLCP